MKRKWDWKGIIPAAIFIFGVEIIAMTLEKADGRTFMLVIGFSLAIFLPTVMYYHYKPTEKNDETPNK